MITKTKLGVGALAAAAALAVPASAVAQFDPTCGLSGGRAGGCPSNPAPAPAPAPAPPQPQPAPAVQAPASDPVAPPEPARAQRTLRMGRFSLSASGRPATRRRFDVDYARSRMSGNATFRTRTAPGLGRVVRITSATGQIRLVHENLSNTERYTLRVRGGGRFGIDAGAAGTITGLVLEVVSSNDSSCPRGRAAFLHMLAHPLSKSVTIEMCGSRYTFTGGTNGARVSVGMDVAVG